MMPEVEEKSIFKHRKGLIKEIKNHPLKNRLISLGIHQGKTIEILRNSVFQGAFYVKIGNQIFGLRKEELSLIVIR